MNAHAVSCRQLGVRWRGRRVLGPLDLDIAAGERVSLHGASGTGKSAFFHALVRRDAYDRDLSVTGTLALDGRSILAERRLHLHRRRVALVPAFPTLIPGNVFDNVAFAPRMCGITDPTSINTTVEQALRTAAVWEDVRDRLLEPPSHFSAGQQQRITIARALAQKPGLLLLDQPFTLLDAVTASALESTFADLPDTTVILATSNKRRAASFAARIVSLGEDHA